MLISELSKRTGVSIHTLRYYEDIGLIKGQTDKKITTNNYRKYDESTIEKIALIIGAKEAGFTLSEIKKLLESWYSKRMTPRKKIKVVTSKIEEIETKIYQLNQVRRTLIEAIKDIENGNC